jgi:Protein of unknown function (DUF2958).
LYGFVGLRIRACARKHKTSFAVPCFGTKACSCIFGFVEFLTMTQPLTTADERTQLLANGAARAASQDIDPLPIVRLFTPDAHATWLLAALDPADGDTAWGLIDLGIGMPVLGTVKLSDLASHRRAAAAPRAARRVFPRGTAAIGIRPARAARRLHSRLAGAHCVFLGLVPDNYGLDRRFCTRRVRP